MAGNKTQVSAHPDALRHTASLIDAATDDFDALISSAKDIGTSYRADASQNTVDGSPSGMHSPVLDAVDSVQTKIVDALTAAREHYTSDAALLRTLADKIDSHEETHAANVSQISANI